MKKKYLFYLFVFILLSCNKRDHKVSWNGHYILPISIDTINAAKILGVDHLTLSNDETHCIYNNNFEFFQLEQSDLLPNLNFNWRDTLEIPSLIHGITFPPGFEIPISYNENQVFNLGDVQIKEINFNSLKLKYTIESNINGQLYLILKIPTAQNNLGIEFTDTIQIPSSNGVLQTFEGSIYLDNYQFDLSKNNSSFNNISTSIRFGFSSNNTQNILFNNEDFLSINLNLEELDINSVYGYLGNKEISDTSEFEILATENFSSNSITIEDPELNVIIENGVGVDAKIKINEVLFKKDQSSFSLQHPIIGQNINLSRAVEVAGQYQYGNAEINFTNQNSNLEEIISLFPEKIDLKYELETNPLGNHSAFNDFYKSPHSISINSGLKIPLKFNLNHFKYLDTISFNIIENIQPKHAVIGIKIENEFPINCCLSVKFLNGDSLLIDSNCIASASVDSSGLLIQSNLSNLEIHLDSSTTNYLINEKKFIFEIIFNSSDNSYNFPVLDFQNLYYKIDLELNTEIEIN